MWQRLAPLAPISAAARDNGSRGTSSMERNETKGNDMKASNLFLVLALGTFGALSCSKSKSGAAAASVPLALAGLGVNAQVPDGSKAEKALVGEGLTIQGPDLVVGVEAAGTRRPKTVAEAREGASMYSPINMKEEALPDGWAITFENKGGIGTNYWVQARREIGGKPIWCDTTASTTEQQANALAVCKSLAK